MGKTVKIFMGVLAVLVVLYAGIQYGLYPSYYAGLIREKLRQADFQLMPWVAVLYIHIVIACVAIVTGWIPWFRKPSGGRSTLRHRRLGVIYAVSVLLSGVVSLYLSLMASGGWIARTGFLAMDIGWLATTWLGVLAILRGGVREHRDWMLRSYALTLAAVTLRLYQFPLMMLFAGEFEPAYRVAAWLCWVPNLLIAEWVVRRQRSNTKIER